MGESGNKNQNNTATISVITPVMIINLERQSRVQFNKTLPDEEETIPRWYTPLPRFKVLGGCERGSIGNEAEENDGCPVHQD